MDASMTEGCVDTHMTDKGLGILLNTLKENSAINLAILELSGICLGSDSYEIQTMGLQQKELLIWQEHASRESSSI